MEVEGTSGGSRGLHGTTDLVFGGDVHVVWEKFCRYFDVEPRIVPLEEGKYTIGPEDVEPHLDENTIGVAAVLGTTFTGHMDDVVGINGLLLEVRRTRDLDIPLHVDAASGGFVWPFLYPDSPWDFRLEQVRSINVSGHKYGLVYPGIGWLVFREKSDLAEDLVFYENYLGKLDLVDGPLVVAHSNDLGEVSHGAAAGTVRDRSLDELREVAPALPTLDEALEFLAARPEVTLQVDLKLQRRLDELAEALRRHAVGARTVVSSFHLESLRAFAAAAPSVPIGFTYPEDRTAPRSGGRSSRRSGSERSRCDGRSCRESRCLLARSGAVALMLHHAVVSRAAVNRAHKRGAAVWAWTVDEAAEVERLEAAGVDAVITNDPRVFSAVATLRS